MEWILIAVFVYLEKGRRYVDRYVHHRGPQKHDLPDVQAEHLWLFQLPPDEEDDRD